MGAALAMAKGRSSSLGVLVCCRKMAALAVAGDSISWHRWIPSDFNAADFGSRLWEPKDKPWKVACPTSTPMHAQDAAWRQRSSRTSTKEET
eukprot:7572759-Pyramimonas_sp.AAC.1